MLQHNPDLKKQIDQLWNKFWAGGISNPLTAIEQITYLLFMKRIDALDTKLVGDAEFTGESYTSKFAGTWIPSEYRSQANAESFAINKSELRWSYFKNLPAEQMLQHVQNKVFPFLRDLNGSESKFTAHMKNAVFIIPKASLLVEAVKIIDHIYVLIEQDGGEKGQSFQDIQGDIYEYLLSEIATAGKNGQFRTPRHIIKLMAELIQPQVGQRILDPACGTAGFILGAYQYIVTQLALQSGATDIQPDEDGFIRTSIAAVLTPEVKQRLEQDLCGYDVDSTMVRLALMNLMMHGIDDPQIDYQDTLSKTFTEEAEYDIVLANPPFTGSIDKGDINEALQLATTKTELLFVENIYRLLKKGGSACLIIPQGVLFGSAKAFVELRKILLDRCDLKAVITMPSGVFRPYAGVSTAILFFTKVYGPKEKVLEPATKHVWFYQMERDGYTLDDKRSKLDGYGDLQEILKAYHNPERTPENESDRTQAHFMVARSEIEAEGYDLSLSRYKQDVFEEVKYDPPAQIIERLLQAEVGNTEESLLNQVQSGIVRDLLELREMLG
jgi:type I restriction enzyme M protein